MDIQHLLMLATAYKQNICKKVFTCEAFVNQAKSFLVMSGTEKIRNFLLDFRFSKDEIEKFKEIKSLRDIFFSSDFETFLEEYRFMGTMKAITEGEIVFANEPLVQITGSLADCLVAESLIPILNCDIPVATRASQLVLASRGIPLIDYQDDINVSRISYMCGFFSSANLKANIPIFNDDRKSFILSKEILPTAFYGYLAKIFNYELYTPYIPMESFKFNDLKTLAELMKEGLNIKIFLAGEFDESVFNISSDGVLISGLSGCEKINTLYRLVYDHAEEEEITNDNWKGGKKQVYLNNSEWEHLVLPDGNLNASENITPLLDTHILDGEVVEESVVSLEVSRRYCNASLNNLPEKYWK